MVSLKFLEYGYYEFGGVRTASVNIDNIAATSRAILCLIDNDYNKKVVGRVGVAI